MNRQRWLIVLCLAIAIPLVSVVCLNLFGPDTFVWRSEIKEGDRIISEIASARVRDGHLPESLSEIGVSDQESDKFFYNKCSDTRFIVWFGTTLGESMTFDSATGSWRSRNIACS
jgi:hypothetical protein